MPSKAASKKAWPKLSYKQRQQVYRDLKQFDKDCELGLVPSGGWCNCCERYDCGCYQAWLNSGCTGGYEAWLKYATGK